MMKRMLVVLATCALSAGCLGEHTYVLVDRRDPKVDVVTVIAGARAFSQEEPFRSPGPPRNLLEAQQFPDSVRTRVRGLAGRRGIRPPFLPDASVLLVGSISPGSSEVAWKYFSPTDKNAASCMDEVRAVMQTTGQPVDGIPDWITAESVRSRLMAKYPPSDEEPTR
jgi:hypothetical protein